MKKIFIPILILASVTNCIGYLYHLGEEQWNQLRVRTPIQKVLDSEDTEFEIKQKLQLVQSVRDFGIRELSLSPESGFVYYVPLNREEIGWNVSASKPLAFESFTWWFPIAGTVPYKGFFDREKAIEEEKYLKSLGLDTRIRVTGGYSTLGWISDPVFSPQLNWDRADLVGLIIHEMSHATGYISGDSVFNESYASFVETRGSELYYEKYLGAEKEWKDWIQKKQKNEIILSEIRKTATQLKEIYESEISESEKIKKKKETIENFKLRLLNSGFVGKENREKFLQKEWNNEDFIGVLRYKSGKKYFEKIFREVNSDWKLFHVEVIQRYKDLPPEEKRKVWEEQ
jgi:predicted aminopeptidase